MLSPRRLDIASTVLTQRVLFSGLYSDEHVYPLHIRITVLLSTDLQTPRTALPEFSATLSVFRNVSTHFFYPSAHSVDASFTRSRLNRRKLNTYRERRPPSWENGTRQVPSQLPHSALWGESTGHRWIPLTKASDAEFWCFLWPAPEQTVEQTIETPVIWDAIALIMTSL